MNIVDLSLPQPPSAERCWTIALPRPRGADRFLRPETMTAAEQMFFVGAPLAHVVQYEEHLKAMRRDQAGRRHARARGTLDLARELAVPGIAPAAASSDDFGRP